MRRGQRFSWGLVMGLCFGLVQGCTGDDDVPPTPTVAPEDSPTVTPPVEDTPTLAPETDADGDGYTVEEGDCDDASEEVYPGAIEVAYDGIDQDCEDGDLTDVDGDGVDAIEAGGDDCNDQDVHTFPGAPEVADGEDNDCDGQVDDNLDTTDDDGDGYSESTGDCDDQDPEVSPDGTEVPYDGVDQDCSGLDLTDVDGDGIAGGEAGADCDDLNASAFPGATEVPYDGVDQDCDGKDLNDQDGDGVAGGAQGTDCDDQDSAVYPGATEVAYDGVDQDCDGVDLNDVDEDGFPALEAGGTDCDDEDPTVNPGASEVAYDGIDQDCSSGDLTDVDGDGVDGLLAGGTDCDDQNLNTFPGAAEYADGADNDCDGKIDEDLNTSDDDGDGFAEVDGDCDDQDVSSHPGGTEVPYDGIDQDCSGADLTDVDGDGFVAVQAAGPDCDDSSFAIKPGATDVPYDGIDQDCTGADLRDVDGDGFEASQVGGEDCDDSSLAIKPGAVEVPYDGIDQDCSGADLTDVDGDGAAAELAGGTDCDDGDAAISPTAEERCDGLDNNCDDVVDTDAVDRDTFYGDADHDGYGDGAKPVKACAISSGLVDNALDCDDTSASSYPGSSERCDGQDNNCDGQVDEGVQATFYKDGDGDGFGAASSPTKACSVPGGYVTNATDCDDTRAGVYPGATESCNLLDDDCDGQKDEGVQTTFFQDLDGDGYGNAAATTQACTAPAGYVADNTDCRDTNDAVHPGQDEYCNGLDDDCDGLIDDGVQTTYYQDADSDGYGGSTQVQACKAPAGYLTRGGDCNDGSASVNPGMAETCNGVDDNCSDAIDEGVQKRYYQDQDLDGYGNPSVSTQACTAPQGYVLDGTDCRDTNDKVYPGSTEVCNALDDDCDGQTDEGMAFVTYYQDADSDGYGNASVSTSSCAGKPAGYVTDKTDCNDASAAVYPGASEVVNGVDDDCDGTVDYLVSCKAIKASQPSASSGIYTIDPDGAGSLTPFAVYCDMATDGGGWTLMGVFTNGDSSVSWSPRGTAWTQNTTFGDATQPAVNKDAKSRAFSEVNVDQVLITRGASTVEVETNTSCLKNNSFLWAFRRNSEYDADCAFACTMKTVASPWSGQSYQDSTLKFRCSDNPTENGGTSPVDGFTQSVDDNYMLTTLNTTSYRDYNFGLGSGYGTSTTSGYADFDGSTDDYGNPGDTTQRLLWGR